MVDLKKEKSYKMLRLFSLPDKSSAIDLIIDDSDFVLGSDINGSYYIGKLGPELKLHLLEISDNHSLFCLNGSIDLSTKLIKGKWVYYEEYEAEGEKEFVSLIMSDNMLNHFENISNSNLDSFDHVDHDSVVKILKLIKEEN